MGWYERSLKQTATYWGAPVSDGEGGKMFAAPVSVSVRWEDSQELFIDAFGKEARSSAVVYGAQVFEFDGYLYLGESTAADPHDVEGAKVIRGFSKIPNIKGNAWEYKAWL